MSVEIRIEEGEKKSDNLDQIKSIDDLLLSSRESSLLDDMDAQIDEPMRKKIRNSLLSNLFLLTIASMMMQVAFYINDSATRQHKLVNYHHIGDYHLQRDRIQFTQCSFMFWIVKCLIVPQLLIKKLGCKSTILVSFLSYLFFYITRRLSSYTLVSSLAIFLNELLGNSFWVAALVYLTDLAHLFVKFTDLPKEFILCFFYSIFYGRVYSSFVSNAFLRMMTADGRYTVDYTDEYGIKFYGFIIFLSVLGTFLTLFLKKTHKQQISFKECNLKQVFNSNQWLMVPITLYFGMFQAFCHNYINEKRNFSHIQNSHTIPIMTYSFVIALTSMLIPMLRKFIIFNLLLIISILANYFTILAVLLNKSDSSAQLELCLSIMLSLSMISLEILLTCHYALLFRDNQTTSFSFYILIKTIGIFLYLLSASMSTESLCYVFIVLLVTSVVMHFIIISSN